MSPGGTTRCRGDRLVRTLLHHRADPSHVDAAVGSNALIWACCGGNMRVVDCLIAHEPTLAQQPDSFGTLPLAFPAVYGQADSTRHVFSRHSALAAQSLRTPAIMGNSMCAFAITVR